MQTLVVTTLSISELETIISDCLKNELRRATPPPRHAGNELPPGEAGSAFLSKREAARLLSCSPSTLDNMRRAGEIKAFYVGKAVRFARQEVLSLAKRHTSTSTKQRINND